MSDLRKAVQPEPEPIRRVQKQFMDEEVLYASPFQRKPLTRAGIYALLQKVGLEAYHQRDSIVQYDYDKRIEEFARAIEQWHGIGV